MTGTTDARVMVLAVGPLAPPVRAALAAEFALHDLPRADPSLVPADIAPQVRGVAVMGAAPGAFMAALPALQIVASFGVGYDGADVGQAARQGVVVTNTPDVLTDEVADTAIGLLINTLRELPRAEAWLRAGRWAAEGPYPLTRGTLRGRKVGIFGLGRIGIAIARRVEAFGLPVAYHNRRPVDGVAYEYYDSLVGLARAVDTLICMAPGTAATRNAVDADVLRALGPDGVFISIGRGSTVDEPALIAALQDGTIMAAGLDVYADEPRVPQALIDLPNACLLPHVGSASVHTRAAMGQLVADNLIAWFRSWRPLTPVPETPLPDARA